MTTSGITTGLMSAQQFVQAAAEELGYLAAGEAITGPDLDLGIRQLNWMLKSMTARGVNLWREEEAAVAVPPGSASIILDASTEDVLSARIQVSQGYQRELWRYTRGQYFVLPNKAAQGIPTIYYVDRQRDAAVLYVWPVPYADTTILLDVARCIQDVTQPDQTIDVPAKWTEALYCALAARLAAPFGVTRTDPTVTARVEQRAAAFEQLLLNEDRPASIYMGAQGERYF